MRVHLPSTLPRLARAVAAGELELAGGTGYAVTAALLAAHPDSDPAAGGADAGAGAGDPEEYEFLAAESAAAAALRLLAAEPGGPARRVVVAADVEDASVGAAGDDEEPERVSLTGPVPLSALASALVDPASLAPTVAAALPVADAPDRAGQPPAPAAAAAWAARAEVEASPLLWFDRSELDALTAGVDTGEDTHR